MKMLIVIGPQSREREIRDVLRARGARAFTEVPDVLGMGTTGAHLDTQAFPGRETLIFSVLNAEQFVAVIDGLSALKSRLYPDERLHAFAIPAEAVL